MAITIRTLKAVSSDLFQRHYYLTPDNRQTALRLEQQIRSALYRLSLLLNAMNDELSLIPVCIFTLSYVYMH